MWGGRESSEGIFLFGISLVLLGFVSGNGVFKVVGEGIGRG